MKSLKNRIILTYVLTAFVASALLYYTIPILLNYGPGTINTNFDSDVSGGLMFWQQISVIAIVLSVIITFILQFFLKDIDNYKIYKTEYEKTHDPKYKIKIDKIKKICFKLPDMILIGLIILPLILEIILLLMQLYFSIADLKLILILFIVTTMSILFANIYVRRILTTILMDLENTENINGRKQGITTRILLQIIPIIIVCILFTFLLVSSMYEKNKGNIITNFYILQFKTELQYGAVNSKDDLIKLCSEIDLNSKDDVLFVLDSKWNYLYKEGELSDFFKKYTKELSSQNNYRIYDYYGTYGQGVLYPVDINGETCYVGAKFEIYSPELFSAILLLLFLLFLANLIILIFFARNLASNIRTVVKSLRDINNNKNLSKQLYITSTDEIGDLIFEYNKITALTKNHISQIQANQDLLIEKERLASLGQLVGGIAHNLKTPIMSVAGATEGIKDLIKEYTLSIEDPSVTIEDHKEIAKEMEEWIDKIRIHISYMSDAITAIKGQAVNFSSSGPTTFNIEELIKYIDVLMKHELNHSLVKLNIINKLNNNLQITTNINSLVQVVNNIISNAIQAYEDKPNGIIDLIFKQENDKLVIAIKDYGPGISKKIQDKLFNSMITTKGKKGTGLGLFMSYSNVKAQLHGNLTFESELGKGTTFYISLPL